MNNDKSIRILTVALISVIACLAVYQAFVVSSFLAERLLMPFPVPYTEAVVYAQIDRLGGAGTIYSDLSAAPFFPSLYPPVFHLLSAGLQSVTGAQMLAPRLVSLAAFACIMLAGICIIAKTYEKQSITIKMMGAGLFLVLVLTLQPIYGLASAGFVDTLAAALSFSCLAVFALRAERRLDTSSFIVVVVLAALAFWVKPTALYGPMAVFVLVLFKDFRAGVQLAVLGAGAALISGFMLWLYFGPDMLTNVFGYTQTRFQQERVILALTVFWARYVPLALFVVLALAGCLVSRMHRQLNDLEKLSICYLAIATLAFLAAGRRGSDWYYIIEFCVALCLAIGCVGARIAMILEKARSGDSTNVAGAFAGTGLILLALSTVMQGQPVKTNNDISSSERQETLRLQEHLRSGKQRIFSADLGMIMTLKQQVWVEPITVFELHRSGLWNIEPVLKLLTDGFYECMLDYDDVLMKNPELRALAVQFPKQQRFSRYNLFCK